MEPCRSRAPGLRWKHAGSRSGRTVGQRTPLRVTVQLERTSAPHASQVPSRRSVRPTRRSAGSGLPSLPVKQPLLPYPLQPHHQLAHAPTTAAAVEGAQTTTTADPTEARRNSNSRASTSGSDRPGANPFVAGSSQRVALSEAVFPSSSWPRSASAPSSPSGANSSGRFDNNNSAPSIPASPWPDTRAALTWQEQQRSQRVPQVSLPPIPLGPEDIQEMDDLIDELPLRRVQRRRAPLSEEHREKIRAALKGKYTAPKSEEHRRKISRAMQRMYMRDDSSRLQRSQAAAGKAKTCSLCGEQGHNRRSCPQNPGRALTAAGTASAAASATKSLQRTCLVCGQVGHNRRTCPQRGSAALVQLPAQAANTAKRTVCCSHCGSKEHNRRTCPELKQQAAAAASTAALGAGLAQVRQQAPLPAQSLSAPGPAVDAGNRVAAVTQTTVAAGAVAPVEHLPRSAARDSPQAQRESVFAAQQQQPHDKGSISAALQPRRQSVALQPPTGLPGSAGDCIEQAAAAVLAGWKSGVNRQRLELLIGGDDATSMAQQLRGALPLVEALLLRLRSAEPEALGGRIMAEMLDDVDCVAAWQSDKLAAVLFPTADTLYALRQLASAPTEQPRLILTINPQWSQGGNVVSDFGFGQARRDAERFIDSFPETYSLQRLRVMGDDVRLLRRYPRPWEAYYIPPASAARPTAFNPGQQQQHGSVAGGAAIGAAGAVETGPGPRQNGPVLLAATRMRPAYAKLLALLKATPGTRASMSWLDRMLSFANARTPGKQQPLDAEHPLLALAEAEEKLMPEAQLPAALRAAAANVGSPGVRAAPGSTTRAGAGTGAGVDVRGTMFSAAVAAEGNAGGNKRRPLGAAGVNMLQQEEEAATEGALQEGEVGGAGEVSTAADRFGELDIITRQPVRDIRMEPVRQIARWQRSLFGNEQDTKRPAAEV